MNETCTWIHDSELCGKPAIEHVDMPLKDGSTIRIWLCAEHWDQREDIWQFV